MYFYVLNSFAMFLELFLKEEIACGRQSFDSPSVLSWPHESSRRDIAGSRHQAMAEKASSSPANPDTQRRLCLSLNFWRRRGDNSRKVAARDLGHQAGFPTQHGEPLARAGVASEAMSAGDDLETTRHHTKIPTTAFYARGTLEKTRAAAAVRIAARKEPKA
ncbi:hypothetical protein [Jiella marina]|uniref:hypothetical protein n=1 Tax=Jiella sp. LLJ827 TaxID=2917712 RepID=UPI0021011E50|nr:hypothetical protein [Jiella sp. LLJ827]MCQ0986484.1 hypothetical protein [Jiella sp. LLJ827]